MTNLAAEPVHQVRERLAAIIDRDTPTVITRHGREVAAIVPIDMLRQFQASEEAELIRLLDQRMASTTPGTPLEDVIAETMARDA